MKTTKIWFLLFLILSLVNIVGLFSHFYLNKDNELSDKNKQIVELNIALTQTKSAYLENAKELKYLLETLLNNSEELKGYMDEYNDVDKETFEEKLRQKVVRLDILIKELGEN